MNYYNILEVKSTASQEEIKDSYKKLVKKYHPDVYKGDKAFAEKKMKDINIAYDVLSNPDSKKAYDEELNPTPKYEYTPPKYSDFNSYYQSQKDSASNTYTPPFSSTYKKVNEMHDNFSNDVISYVSKLKIIQKLFIFLTILLIYLVLFLLTYNKFNLLNSGKYTGPLLNEQQTSPSSDKPKINSNKNSNEFNINNYIDDITLYRYYEQNPDINKRYTYDEFKEILTEKFKNYIE